MRNPEHPRQSTAQRFLLQLNPGKDLRTLLCEAYELHGTIALAAEAIGINELTFRNWLRDVGLRVEVEVRVERKGRLVPINAASELVAA